MIPEAVGAEGRREFLPSFLDDSVGGFYVVLPKNRGPLVVTRLTSRLPSPLSLFLLQQAALTLMEQHFAINALHTQQRQNGTRTDAWTDRTPKQEDPFIHDQI